VTDLPTGTVTFLFTDIEGSTRLQYEVGVERYAEIRAEHHRVLRDACARNGGVEVDAAGDGLFVAFPTASGGVAAAIDAQLALRGLVAVRMGLHSGEPHVTPEGYAGIDVANAARIAGVAHGGQILLSQTTADLIGDPGVGVSARGLGEHALKDLPGPQELYQVVAEGLVLEFPPLKSLGSTLTNLPTQRPVLIGREEELREVTELLRGDRRLITLTGPGGTGKTSLALEAAARMLEEFPDGVFLVRLETIDDPALVLGALADVLSQSAEERSAPDLLVADFLRDRRALVILDNFEYVLEAAPAVADLLDRAPDARALVTSVAPLRVSGELEFPLEPLRLPERGAALEAISESPAVVLFAERARAARPGFALSGDNASAVAQVCVALDGLPLALELAAARTRVLSPSALLERVERPLALLEGGARDAPDRHRTLRATIDWSYDLLDEPQQRLFARLSVFSGGATLEAIDAICRPADDLGLDVVDGIARLVECSLLKTEERGDELRFVLLETLREYAREQLESSGDADELHGRHAEFFLGDPARVEVFRRRDRDVVVARTEAELDNVRAGLEWARATRSPLELALAITYQRSSRVFPAEARQVLESALEHDDGRNPRLRARALAALGGITRELRNPQEAQRALEESARIYRELDDTTGTLVVVLLWLAAALEDQDDFDAAERVLREAEALARQSHDSAFQHHLALGDLALIAITRGHLDEARGLLAQSAELASESDLPQDWLIEPTRDWFIEPTWVFLEIVEGRGDEATARAAAVVDRLDLGAHNQGLGWNQLHALAAALHAAGATDAAVELHSACAHWHAQRGVSHERIMFPRLYARLWGGLDAALASAEYEAAAREGRELDLDAAVAFGLAAAARVTEQE
jgi:predicted ATPase/class 3 adenylate cyclase